MQEMQETPVLSLGQEDPLEKEMATHSSILTWKIPWMEEPDRLQSLRSQRVTRDLMTKQQQHHLERRIRKLERRIRNLERRI